MPALGNAELTVQERGILSTSASAVDPDCFSKVDRLLGYASRSREARLAQRRRHGNSAQTTTAVTQISFLKQCHPCMLCESTTPQRRDAGGSTKCPSRIGIRLPR